MSDLEDDSDHLNYLKEAIDFNFINDSMFQNIDKLKASLKNEPEIKKKSARHIDLGVDDEKDIKITESMKKHISKKLSEIIDKQVCFVEPKQNYQPAVVEEAKDTWGVRLFSDSTEFIKEIDQPITQINFNNHNSRKRSSTADSLTHLEKCRAAAIDPKFILSKSDTKNWSSRRKSHILNYKTNNSILYLQEEENEFSKLKKKNNWNESKIARSPELKNRKLKEITS